MIISFERDRDFLESIFEKIHIVPTLIVGSILIALYLFVEKKNTGYGLTSLNGLKQRLYSLARLFSMTYLIAYLVFGMFVMPINYLASAAAMGRALLFIFVAITIFFIIQKIVFNNRIFVYLFAVVNSAWVAYYFIHHAVKF